MIKFQPLSDKAAISLSLLCAFHCLALPLLLVLLPSMASLQLDNEAFHFWMILAVLPTSIYALTLGCKQHKRTYLLVLGAVGLALLLSAVLLPESLFGERGEKIFTLLGAGLISIAHFKNYRLCRQNKGCKCPSHQGAM